MSLIIMDVAFSSIINFFSASFHALESYFHNFGSLLFGGGIATASIAIWEACTNRSKLKLSLYEKRLEIFKSSHELYLTLFRDEPADSFNDKYFIFKLKYRAARFLFDIEDSELLVEQLKKFGERADALNRNMKSNSAEELIEYREPLRIEMENILAEIEKKIQPYLQAPIYHFWRHSYSTIISHIQKVSPFKLYKKYKESMLR